LPASGVSGRPERRLRRVEHRQPAQSILGFRDQIATRDPGGVLSKPARMKILGIILIVIWVCWAAMCFLGVAMMSRSVDMFTEAMLPALVGVAVAAVGLMLVARPKPPRA
jgi:hypothetical protein